MFVSTCDCFKTDVILTLAKEEEDLVNAVFKSFWLASLFTDNAILMESVLGK